MDENKPGKRVASGGGVSQVQKRVIIISCAVVLALVLAYLALCAYVTASGTILPRTTAHGIPLGGMSASQAQTALEEAATAQYGAQVVTITYTANGAEETAQVPGAAVGFDAVNAAQLAWGHGREYGFFAQGFALLSNLVVGHDVNAPLFFSDEASVDTILEDIGSSADQTLAETTYTVRGDELVFHMGVSGVTVNLSGLKEQVLTAFEQGGSALNVRAESTVESPAFPDLDAIHAEIYAEAANAGLDAETKDVIPAVVGMDFDVTEARTLLESAKEGSDCSIPLTLTQPEISTETLIASLFRDVLGEATSRVSGSANRKYNVKLSAQACHEKILLPGEIFAYNQTTGSRSAAKGYLPAPAYVGGLSVDELGGGICQTSSTIYYATLNANLKIVERQNHMYAVGYVPDGMDATVYYGSLDFRFENDTAYPLKIVTESYDKGGVRYLTVKIMGTKTNDTYVKMTNREISSITPETVYKADPTVPMGAQPKPDPQSTAYRGRKVEAYRNVYAADGTLISSTLESVNNYKKRDRILLVNPADLASYQATGLPTPVATPIPSAVPTPTTPAGEVPVIPSPAVTEPLPTVTPPVTTTPPPTVDTPSPTPIAATPTPDNGIPTLTPPPVTVEGSH